MSETIFVLGGAQTDFARHAAREGRGIADLMADAISGAVDDAGASLGELEVAHVGNFTGELFARQGQLGGLVVSLFPALGGLPTSRHEAACASGGVAALAAMADLEAGRYDVACVLGVELMRNVPGDVAAANLGVAAWTGKEAEGARYVWPHLFARLTDHYRQRFGIDRAHLVAIARKNLENAKRNPRAQTRGWTLDDAMFAEDDAKNPIVEGSLRRQDCAQITDGAAAVVLATERFAAQWAARRGTSLGAIPRIRGWGHRTAPMALHEKLAGAGRDASPWVLPHLRGAIEGAWRRAGLSGIDDVDAVELHDCFTITEYVVLEHLGLAPVGAGFRAIESGRIHHGGKTPVNPGGGLIGGGHPVGATGVRMLLDAARQVTGRAGDAQVPGARTVQTVNIGGSATTSVSFVVGV